MDHRLIQFDRQLRLVVGPALVAAGFLGEPMRCWRREVRHEGTESHQIIAFEVGTGAQVGEFTVNLAIFNADYLPTGWPAPVGPPHPHHCLPDLSQRLGRLAPRSQPGWLERLLQRPPRTEERWWTLTESAGGNQRGFGSVLRNLDLYGLTWLDSHTSVAAFTAARDRLQAQGANPAPQSPAPG